MDNNGNGVVDEEGEPNRIGLSGFTITTNRGGPREDPNTDKEAYRIMINAPGEVTEPQWDPDADLIVSDFENDLRARLLTGPFDLPADGSLQKVEVGYLFADPLRNPPNPADITLDGELINLVGLAQTVQTTFDTDFNLPAPPVSPNMQLLDRDGMVIVTWDDLPEKTSDPFYPVSQVATNPDGTPAATYNPDYLEYDFQGYRVYRSLTTSAKDARLVAQFDKADGITTGSAAYTTQTGQDVNGDGIPDFPDVSHDPFDIGFSGDDNVIDNGLRYIWVDHGQGLSNRESLINGVHYYYAVTAFDYQASNTGQESLESGMQLVSLDASGNNMHEGTPRTSANGYFPPSVGQITQIFPDGSPVGEPATMTLGANGLLVETTPQPAADNGLTITNVTIANGDPAVLPTELYLVVDSVINVPDDFDPGLGIYHDGLFQVHLRAEDGNGQTLGSTIVNTKGFYDPFGPDVQIEGSIPLKSSSGDVIASVDVSVWGDNWNGLVIEPIQVSGSIAYDNLKQANQRTHMTDYFWWLYGFADYAYLDGMDEIAAMPTLATAFNIGHIEAGTRTADLELKWSGSGNEMTLEVTDLSNRVPVRFNQLPNDGWGFVPKNRSALDIQIDHQTAHQMFDVFFATVLPSEEIISAEVTLADGSKRPYAVDDGIRRNLYLVSRLGDAIKPSDWDVQGRQFIEDGEVVDEIGDHIADLTGTQDLDLFVCGVMYQINGITALPSAGDVWKIRMRQHIGPSQNRYRGGTNFPGTAVYDHRRPVAGNKWKIELTPERVDLTARNLSKIRVVPNPYIASSPLDLTTSDIELQFINLPGNCTIRIYTVAGHLVDVLDHTDGTGTETWGIRSRFNQKIASGYYIYNVEDHETGGKHMGKFAIVH